MEGGANKTKVHYLVLKLRNQSQSGLRTTKIYYVKVQGTQIQRVNNLTQAMFFKTICVFHNKLWHVNVRIIIPN